MVRNKKRITSSTALVNRTLMLLVRGLANSPNNRSQGFTLVEVMVSIILLTAFMSATMTALATASLVKVRANGSTIATNWIEEDLEEVRLQAALTPFNAGQCNATSSSAGFANALQLALPAVARGGTQTIASKTYTLTRQAIVAATAPFEVLQLTYTVTESGNRSALTTMYTEVIPNAAFECARF